LQQVAVVIIITLITLITLITVITTALLLHVATKDFSSPDCDTHDDVGWKVGDENTQKKVTANLNGPIKLNRVLTSLGEFRCS
jgi:hypothetical protein